MKLAVSICLYRRKKNWDAVLRGLRAAASGIESQVCLAMWNNDKDSTFSIPDGYPIESYVVNSGFNAVCVPRYHLPLIINGVVGNNKITHFLFLDDDVTILPDFLRTMMYMYDRVGDPNALIGTRGSPLTDTTWVTRSEGETLGEIMEVDYLTGHSLMGSIHLLSALAVHPVPDWAFYCEDLWFMYASQKVYGSRKYVVPAPKVKRLKKRDVWLAKSGNKDEIYTRLRNEFRFQICKDSRDLQTISCDNWRDVIMQGHTPGSSEQQANNPV